MVFDDIQTKAAQRDPVRALMAKINLRALTRVPERLLEKG